MKNEAHKLSFRGFWCVYASREREDLSGNGNERGGGYIYAQGFPIKDVWIEKDPGLVSDVFCVDVPLLSCSCPLDSCTLSNSLNFVVNSIPNTLLKHSTIVFELPDTYTSFP